LFRIRRLQGFFVDIPKTIAWVLRYVLNIRLV
jgi:hypothetical protein